MNSSLNQLASLFSGRNIEYHSFSKSLIVREDCIRLLKMVPENSFHGIVTDPPFGVKEFTDDEILKKENGKGGIWRIPPAFDGNKRAPLPRFTALNDKDREQMFFFFIEWGKLVLNTLLPGAHIFIASNSFMSQFLFSALVKSGLEFRGQIIRIVRTLRGGDRPKNAEIEFEQVSTLPRGCYEPWGIFRKPMPRKMKVSECLREYKTGGLRRNPDGTPFTDVIISERTPIKERNISNHPSMKPQSFIRKLVYAILPIGEGIILDPFMGSGTTIAAAESLSLQSIGIEKNSDYFNQSKATIPKLIKSSTYEFKIDRQQNLFFNIN